MRPARKSVEVERRNHEHATPFTLAIELDELQPEETLAVAGRVSECSGCRGALERLADWLEVLDHWRPAVGPEYVTRHRLFSDLLATRESHAERLERVRSEGIFHHWGLCRLLLEEAQRIRSRDLRFAVELGELACEIAALLEVEFYSAAWVADLRTVSTAQIAESFRRLGRLDQAEEGFRRSRGWLRSGTGRAGILALVDALEGLLVRDQGREWEAWLLVERSAGVLGSRELGSDLGGWGGLLGGWKGTAFSPGSRGLEPAGDERGRRLSEEPVRRLSRAAL